MKLILALLFATASAKVSPIALNVRGGASIGPLDSGLAGDLAKVATSMTIGSAVVEKYGGLGSTTLSNFFKGDLFSTNAIITLVASCASNFFVGTCGSGFDGVKLAAGLWVTSLVLTLKNDGASVDTVMANKEATVIAALLAFMAFVE